jgi:Ca2+-binding RTX toxin-like protein
MRTSCLLLVLALLVPATASAGTVSTASSDATGTPSETLRFVADAHELNNVVVTTVGVWPGSPWIVSDETAPLRAGDGCTALDGHTARCALTDALGDLGLTVELGDGDDGASVRTWCGAFYGSAGEDFTCAPAVVHGGDGRDVLFGSDARGSRLFGDGGGDFLSAGHDGGTLRGGSGDDELRGSPARDRLLGEGGADVIRARDGRRDRIDGGRGRDTARIDGLDAVTRVERRSA